MINANAPKRFSVRLSAVSMALTGFVIVVVNYLIYHARIVFSWNNPDYVAVNPPTISRAISDPIVGEPFANWMLVCAPVLFVGVSCLVLAIWHEVRRAGSAPESMYRVIRAFCATVIVLQAMASVGMVMLSQYRFPDHDEMHMTGSYLFFCSQAFVVVFGEIYSRRVWKASQAYSLLSARMVQVRKVYIWVPVFLGVTYLSLFTLKNYEFGTIDDALYQAYTITELLLISSFLGYVLSFHGDMFAAIRRYLRA